jgi:putative spermidine/putrescine transport system permease protein
VWGSFALSFYVAASSTFLTLAAALAITLVLRRQLDREPLGTLIYLPLAIPATVSAFLALQFLSGSGVVARVLIRLGFHADAGSLTGLTNDAYAVGIILAHVGIAVPFFVLLLAQTYKTQQIRELNQVAAGLGTSKWSRLTRVTLPILIRRVMPNSVLFFIYVMGAYEIPLLLGRQSPQMLSVLAMRKYAGFDITQKPEAFAIAFLYAILVSAVLVSLRRQIRPGAQEQ